MDVGDALVVVVREISFADWKAEILGGKCSIDEPLAS